MRSAFTFLLGALLATQVGISSAIAAQERGLRRVAIKTASGENMTLYKGSHALLVGVSDYTAGWPDLESIPGELQRLERALKSKGFSVTKLMNPTSRGLERGFEDFIDKHGFDAENRLLFFFAGHGYTRNKGSKGYIVPADAPNPERNEKGFLRKAVRMSKILAWARDIESKHALFLFDSCFSGAVFKARDLPKTPPAIRRITAKPVRQFITAGQAGETVPAKSTFTPAFIDAITHGLGDLNSDGYVSGMELGLYLQNEVPKHTRQTPQFGKIQDYDLSRGDFIFMAGGLPQDQGGTDLDAEKKAIERARRETAKARAELKALRREKARLTSVAKAEAERRAAEAEAEQLRKEVAEARREAARLKKQRARHAKKPTKRKLRRGDAWTEPVTGATMVWLPKDCFQMGVEKGNSDEMPRHKVCLDGFWIGKYEVTQGQWNRLMDRNPSKFKVGGSFPVERISWDDAQTFLKRLNSKSRHRFRLPTEAEWEYACTSGGRDEKFSGGNTRDAVAWTRANSGGGTHKVGTKPANGLGLHDMSGNVWEWVSDWHGKYYYKSSPRDNPTGPASGKHHVYRGGTWDGGNYARCRFRGDGGPQEMRGLEIGMRLVRE